MALSQAGFDSDGDLVVDVPNEPDAVIGLQQGLFDLGCPIEVDGDYGSRAAEPVPRFTVDQRLALSPGIQGHDGVTSAATMARLDQLFAGEIADDDQLQAAVDAKPTKVAGAGTPTDPGSQTGEHYTPYGAIALSFGRGADVRKLDLVADGRGVLDHDEGLADPTGPGGAVFASDLTTNQFAVGRTTDSSRTCLPGLSQSIPAPQSADQIPATSNTWARTLVDTSKE